LLLLRRKLQQLSQQYVEVRLAPFHDRGLFASQKEGDGVQESWRGVSVPLLLPGQQLFSAVLAMATQMLEGDTQEFVARDVASSTRRQQFSG
jgi:hypothetical protein